MKKLCLILAACFAVGMAHGAAVSWGTNESTGIIGAGGLALQQGNWVQIGFFQTIADTTVTSLATTQAGTALLAADFLTFSSGQVPASPFAGGLFVGSASNANPAFATQQIYFWAMKSTDNSSLTAAEGSVFQQAIAYLPKNTIPVIGDAWKFPDANGAAIVIDLEALMTAGTSTTGRQVLAGTFIPGANNSDLVTNGSFPSSNNALQLQSVSSVPEPSTLTFGALAALAAAGSRRRRRQ
jgi:MYXO-CTERM domain-containing protein